MKKLMFNISVALLIAAVAVFARWGAPASAMVFHTEVSEYADLAQKLNIRNMVSAVYLGPRVLDTLLEAMVVVLAVQGMAFIRRIK